MTLDHICTHTVYVHILYIKYNVAVSSSQTLGCNAFYMQVYYINSLIPYMECMYPRVHVFHQMNAPSNSINNTYCIATAGKFHFILVPLQQTPQ